VIRCRCVDDKEADRNCLCLGAITEDAMEVNVVAGGNFLPGKARNRFVVWDHGGVCELKFLVRGPIEDVDGAALVDEDFLDYVVFYFNGDDHRVILLVIKALKIVVREGYWGHATFVMGMGYVVDGLDTAEVSLPSQGGGSSTSKTTKDGVDSAAQGRVGGGDISASRLGVIVCGLVWAFIMARVTKRASVVRTRRVMGSGGVIIFSDKATEMANTN